MQREMETVVMGYVGTTIGINSFIPSQTEVEELSRNPYMQRAHTSTANIQYAPHWIKSLLENVCLSVMEGC